MTAHRVKPASRPADATGEANMDLRGIDEIRPDQVAELSRASGAGGDLQHAFSHVSGDGAVSLVRREAGRTGVFLGTGDSADGVVSHGLLSASVLKIRCGGHGVVRLQPDEDLRAQAGWDGSGWLGRLSETA